MSSGEGQSFDNKQSSAHERANPTVDEIQRLLSTLPQDEQREFIGSSFMQFFGKDLSHSASTELHRVLNDVVKQESAVSTHYARTINTKIPIGVAESQASTPEDQWLDDVKDAAVCGKFPNGVTINGKILIEAQPWFDDYVVNSFTGWRANDYHQRHLLVANFDQNARRHTFPEMGILAITPDKEEGYSCLSYMYPLDESIRDRSGRYAPIGNAILKLPSTKAHEIIETIKKNPDGADIAERFLQKAAPGILAKDNNSTGIRRARTSELFVVDEEVVKEYFGEDFLKGGSAQQRSSSEFSQLVSRHPELRKTYKTPVGTGRLPTR